MGNTLSHRDSRLALPADDDKWLKMKALAYFESQLQEEYSKLPAFEGTERATPQSTQASSSSASSSSGRDLGVRLICLIHCLISIMCHLRHWQIFCPCARRLRTMCSTDRKGG